MIDDPSFWASRDWIKRTASETADVVRYHIAKDHEQMIVLLAHMIGRAVFDEHHDDVIFWACVFAHVRREPLNETSKRELRALLEGSRRWGH
jgi:hypothetical protein